jgi:peptide/nickel transport system permease protein
VLIPLLPIGLAMVLVAAAMSGPPDLLRWAIGVAGALGSYFGFEAAGRRVSGDSFDAGFWLSAGWVVVVVLAALFADLLPLAEAQNTAKALSEPSRQRPDLFSNHPLGTDSQGLDVLGGIIYGARVSLQVSILAVSVGLVIGGTIGVTAGYFRGKIDDAVGFFTDSLLAFPPLILLLAIVTAITPTATKIGLALALLGIPTMARLARANTLTFAQREFVLAARAMGASNRRVIFRELVPNVVRPLLSYAFIIVAVLIVAEASLSFLGVGIQRPTPTWGNMIAAAQDDFQDVPHLVFLPGVAMFLTVFSLNRVGDRLREMWDPKDAVV